MTIAIPITKHDLKAWPVHFEMMWQGLKTFEIRYDDRGFQRGDKVRIREWDRRTFCECPNQRDHDNECERYSGREINATIGYVMASTPSNGGVQRGFSGNGYVVFSLCDVEQVDGRGRAAGVQP